MRKLLLVLSLLIVFFVGTGMKSIEAQICWIEPGVSWSGNCVYPDDNTVYVAKLVIWDECVNPSVIVFEEDPPQTISTNYTQTDFCVEDVLCTIDQTSQCFKVIFTVAKVNVNTQAIICSGQTILYKNCEGLMALDGVSTNVVLN